MRHHSAHTYRLYKNCKGKSIVLMRVGRTAVRRANLATPAKNPHSSEWGVLLIGVFNVEKSIRRTIPSANTFFKIISHFKKIVNI